MPLENINNALVSDGAPIQPPQAFVETAEVHLSGNFPDLLKFNTGLTRITTFSAHDYLTNILRANSALGFGAPTVDFQNQALDSDSVHNVMIAILQYISDPGGAGTLNINGGTSAAPDAADLTNVTGGGWTVNHN